MASLEINIPHHLSQEEALEKIKNLLSETKKEHGDMLANLTENWNGNTGEFSFSAKGFDISGTLTVSPTVIEMRGKVPFAVSLFKGKITQLINEKAKDLLG